jgi:uncharacterized membrane protein
MFERWQFLSVAAPILWGISYTALKPATDVHPCINFFISGSCYLIVSIIWMMNFTTPLTSTLTAFQFLGVNFRWLYLCLYTMISIAANVCFTLANWSQDAPISIITALSSAYPAITFIGSCIFFKEYQRIKLSLALPGIILIIGGSILLALSNNTSVNNNYNNTINNNNNSTRTLNNNHSHATVITIEK